MIALLAAGTLILSLGTDPLLQQTPRFIDIQRTRQAPQASLEVVSTEGYPPPLRSRCWWIAGGYGLGAAFASIAGVIAENIVRSQTSLSSSRSVRTDALGMLIGFAVGVGPGALLGNEARKEENGLARGVITMLAGGGTVALAATAQQIF